MKQAKVSIIMPAYNAARFISGAVESVIGQTWPSWELVVVNDGSTDETGAYLDSLIDPRIRVIHQPNRGVSAARNVALDAATGEYVTFLDADDALPPESLRVRMEHLLSHPEIDIVDGAVSLRDAELATEHRLHRPVYDGLFLLPLLRLDPSVFCHISYVLKHTLVRDVRFHGKMTHVEDILFSIHVAAQQPLRFAAVPDLVYLYRTGHPSAMQNLDGMERGYVTLIEEVSRIRGVTSWDMVRLRSRVARILLLSWRARGSWQRGVRAAARALVAGQ